MLGALLSSLGRSTQAATQPPRTYPGVNPFSNSSPRLAQADPAASSPSGQKPVTGAGDKSRSTPGSEKTAQSSGGTKTTGSGPAYTLSLSPAEQQAIAQLQARDVQVKDHEQAHMSAGGRYVRGGPHYTYQVGPDGKMYAVGGEVSIDTSPVPNDPRATIQKAQAIERAAEAPAQPSAQDAAVASQARAMEMQARIELQHEERQAQREAGSTSDTAAPASTVRMASGQNAGEAGSLDQASAGNERPTFRHNSGISGNSSQDMNRMWTSAAVQEYARMAAQHTAAYNPLFDQGLHIQA